jgi:pimeloyl-ACP methyl ester carboxylesterase
MLETIGKLEYAAIMRGLGRVARLRAETLTIGTTQVRVLARTGKSRDRLPLLLLHGFGADKENWLPMAPFVDRRRALVLPDLPGFGASSPVAPAFASAAAQSRVLREVLDRHGIDRFHVAGNSMGGGIALRLAHDCPERIVSMTLLGSLAPTLVIGPEVKEAMERGENPLIASSKSEMADTLKLIMARQPLTTPTMRRYLGAKRFAAREAHHQLFIGWHFAAEGEGIPSELAKLHTPALVLHGERDRVIALETSTRLAEALPNAKLKILRGVGHVPQLEIPYGIARRLEKFMQSIEANAPSAQNPPR